MADTVIEVEWPDLKVKLAARPLDYNRRLFDAFCTSLPFETVQLHAVVTGEDMYAYSPLSVLKHQDLVEKRIRICDGQPGLVTWSGLGLVAIIYGPCTEPLNTQPIAQIEDIASLRIAGKAAWESIYTTKQILKVNFRKRA